VKPTKDNGAALAAPLRVALSLHPLRQAAEERATASGQLTRKGFAAMKISDGFVPWSNALGNGESRLIRFRYAAWRASTAAICAPACRKSPVST
jgi:hypothetical protein